MKVPILYIRSQEGNITMKIPERSYKDKTKKIILKKKNTFGFDVTCTNIWFKNIL